MKRVLQAVLAVLILVPLAILLGGNALLDTGPAHARIAAAIARATGHPARIDGRISLAWSLEPALSIEGVAIANSPGFSRPNLATARRVEARIALLPLIQGRIELPGLWIIGADIHLERDATGRGNWQAAAAAPPAIPAQPSPARPHTPVAIERIQLVNGMIAWQDAPPIQVGAMQASPAGGPMTASVTLRGIPFEVVGATQPPAPDGTAFEVTAVGGGLAIAASGQLGGPKPQPIAVQAKTADLSTLAPLAGRPLPSLQNILLTGQLTANGPASLAVTGLTLTAGPSDLTQLLPGLTLTTLRATLPALDQPVQLQASATLRALPITLAATFGPRAPATPVQLQLAADGATLAIQASLDGSTDRLTQATIAARIPNLARTATLAGFRTPGLRDAAIDVRIQPTPAGNGFLLRGLRIASAQGDLAGDLALNLAPRPSLKGSLVSQHLDFDAWTRQPKPTKPTPDPAPKPTLDPAPAAQPGTAPQPLIPGRPLPFAALASADADLRWSVATIASRGVTYQSAALRILLQDGRLHLDPASLLAPGGPIQLTLQADANPTPPTAALTLHAPNVDAAAVAAAAGRPGAITGTLDAEIDLHATGDTPRALAATATGHAALALTDGEIQNATLATLFAPALRGANIPLETGGASRLRCLATRLDATDGHATIRTLALDTSKLRLDGDGTLDLGAETMDLHLRPTIRLGPTTIAVPVHLAGPWRAPRAANDRGIIAPGRFGISIGAATPDPCGPALAEIRAP